MSAKRPPTETKEKMLSIRIPYEVGRRMKAVCALRGVTVRDVVSKFATAYVEHADELPAANASPTVKVAALGAAMMRRDYEPKHAPTARKPKG